MGGVGGLHSHYIVKPNLVLRLGWGFDNNSGILILLNYGRAVGAGGLLKNFSQIFSYLDFEASPK